MAFCPLCGKKLPDNGICSCGQRLDENGNIVSNAAPVQEAVVQASAPVQEAAAEAAAPVQEAVAQAVPEAGQAVGQATPQLIPNRAVPQPQAAPAPQPQAAPASQPQAAPAPQHQAVPTPQPQAVPTPQPQAAPVAPGAPAPQQAPAAPPVPKAPAGPNVFGEAFKMFPKVFKNPAGANQEALDGKLPVGSALILGGLYFFVVWWSLTFLLFGACSIKFLPAWGFGALGGLFFCGIRCGAAFLISLLSKNKDAKFMKVLSALCVDTLLLDCILVVMMLFQFATVYFAVFFMLIYLGLIYYQNTELFRKLAVNAGTNAFFWFNVVLIACYAFLIMIAYIIYGEGIPYSAYKGLGSLSSWLDW